MKVRVKLYLMILISFVIIFASTVSASQEQSVTLKSEKPQFATITKRKVNKKNVKPGDFFKYSFTITNTGLEKIVYDYDIIPFSETKKIHEVILVWQSPKKQSIECSYTGKYNKKTKTFQISDKIKIQKGMQEGTWKLKSIILSAYHDVGEDDYYSASAKIYNSKIKNDCDNSDSNIMMDLSFADFRVRGTGKKLDREGPTVSPKGFNLSKKSISTKQKSKFTLKVRDKSKIKSVECVWAVYENGYKDPDYIRSKMKYNKKRKIYEYNVKLQKKDKKAKLIGIYLKDIYDNYRDYRIDNGKAKSLKDDFYGKHKNYLLGKKFKKVFSNMIVTNKKK